MTESALQRASDADRDRVAGLLGDASVEGYLRTDELDERLTRAMAARTSGELAALTADLPEGWVRRRAAAEREPARRAAVRAGLVAHVSSYAGVMVLLVGIWLAVGLAGGGWYPWPVWPALGWGIGVASHARAVTRGVPVSGCGAHWAGFAQRQPAARGVR